MQTPTNMSEAGLWVFWALTELLTKWTPAVVSVAIGVGPGASSTAPIVRIGTITEPVTAMQVVDYLHGLGGPDFYSTLYQYWLIFVAVSIALSLLFAVLLIRSSNRLAKLRNAEHAHFAKLASEAEEVAAVSRSRWDHINDQLHAGTEHGWRIAILEADILLKEMLDMLGYRGETIADQLRLASRAHFATLDMAWEAHRARNRIAHEIGGGGLTQAEARRVISLYAHVFKEFDFKG